MISDLHLGSYAGVDLLRRPAIRSRLLTALAGVDQVVLLGDVLELREASIDDALALAQPLLEDLGELLDGGRVVLVPGNHDHVLAGAVLRQVGRAALGLEHVVAPADGLARIAGRMGRTELALAYPGLWIRPDVYATHGHYLDLHNSVPTFESVAVSANARASGGLPPDRATPGDYEAALQRVYDLIDILGQATKPSRVPAGADVSIRAWQRLAGTGGAGAAARLVAGTLFPGAVAVANRAGLGPYRADLSSVALRRSGTEGMAEVVRRLGIQSRHVIFGHTHRSGPWPAGSVRPDAPGEWSLPGGATLTNSGSWAYQPAFLTPRAGESPYWPGGLVRVADSGEPALTGVLTSVSHSELA